MKRIKSYELFLKESRFPADDEQVELTPCVKCDCEDCTQCDCEKCNCPKCCDDNHSLNLNNTRLKSLRNRPTELPGKFNTNNKLTTFGDEIDESDKKFEFFFFLETDKGLPSVEKELLICIMDMNYDEVSTKEDIINRCCSDCKKEDLERAFSNLESKGLIHYDSELNDYKPTQNGFKVWNSFENPKNYEITRRNYR